MTGTIVRFWSIAALVVAGLPFAPGHAVAAERILSIGTGGEGGIYFPAGRAICRLMNQAYKGMGPNCVAKATKGSIANLLELRAGRIGLAIVQSDWHFHSLKGTSKFRKLGADKNLRSVFSLHTEAFTIMARSDAGIRRLGDLPGKRVNIGNTGSGARGTMEVVMHGLGWKKSSFAKATELDAQTQARALCNGNIDAMIYTVGHPSAFVHDAARKCQTVLINVSGPQIDGLVKSRPYYSQTWIPAGIYKGSTREIKTFGVSATLVTRVNVSVETIQKVVKSVFQNLRKFKSAHPALKRLNKRGMVRDGLSAPMHPGAVKFFKSAGLL